MSNQDIERAEEHQQFLLQQKIATERAKVPVGIGPTECDCGNEIPVKRRELGYHSCVTCAQTQERKDALKR